MFHRLRAFLDSAFPRRLDRSTALSALLALAIAPLLLLPTAAIGAVLEATSKAELLTALENWTAGDEIEIQNGTYDDWGQVWVSVSGTAVDPLVIRGESKTGVIFTGDSNFFIDASHIEFKIMTFYDLLRQDIIESQDPAQGGVGPRPGGQGPGGSVAGDVIWSYNNEDIVFKDLVFEDIRAKSIRIDGPTLDVRVEDSEFLNCGDPDCEGEGSNGCGDDWANVAMHTTWGGIENLAVTDNEFTDYLSTAVLVRVMSNWEDHDDIVSILRNVFTDGRTESAVTLGSNPFMGVDMNAIVADNVIDGHSNLGSGPSEMFTIKSRNNRILNNQFLNVGGQVSNRGGSNNVYDGNYFLNAIAPPGALRIHDADNQVTNNIFVGGKIGLRIMGVEGSEADRALIANNTFVGQTQWAILFHDIDAPGRPPEDMIFINNVIVGDADDLISDQMHSSTTMVRNLFHATSGTVTESDPIWGSNPYFEDPFTSSLPPDLADLDPDDTFGATSFAVARGLSVTEFTALPEATDYLGVTRPATRGTDLGHLENLSDACPDPGDATSTVTPVDPTVTNGDSLAFLADSISDPEGLGYPLLWGFPTGSGPSVNALNFIQIWEFNAEGSSGASVANPLMAWIPNPTVTFDKGSITVPTNHPMELTVYDQTGCETLKDVGVTVDPVPPTTPANVWGGVAGAWTFVSWDASYSELGIDHYTIFRDGVPIATRTTTAFFETPGTGTYLYTVDAVDPYGNTSPQSSPAIELEIP